jgi:hypothetical protein
MDAIHFTHGATDPLTAFDVRGVCFLPIADGGGRDSHLGCTHLGPGASIAVIRCCPFPGRLPLDISRR